MFGALGLGLCLLFLLNSRVDDLDRGRIARMIGAMIVSAALFAPYLYSVVHAKTGGEGMPLGFSAPKLIGLVVSCALVIFLAAFQIPALIRSRRPVVWLLLCTTASVIGACIVVNLPAANSHDKLPFLIFFPLAIVGGWTIADFAARASSAAAVWPRFTMAAFLLFAPINLFMLSAYYSTPPILRIDDNEKQIAHWVRQHTSRDAVFFDNNNRAFLLVAGPRRYYIGHDMYAKIWGYNNDVIGKRIHVKENLYSPEDPDVLTLETLGAMPEDVYVIVRSTEPEATIAKFTSLPELFQKIYAQGGITLYQVNRPACREIADALGGST
jgi:hypothetical protein